MTPLEQLQAQRADLLTKLGIVRISSGERSVEYGKIIESIAFLDSEIAKLTAKSRFSLISTTRQSC